MKIGIDARMLGCSGIGRYAKNLIENLAKIDSQNQYVLFVYSERGRRVNKSSVVDKEMLDILKKKKNWQKIEVSVPYYSWAEQTSFLLDLKKQKCDLIHFTHFNRPIFYQGKTVLTIHDLTPLLFPGKKRTSPFERLAYRLVLKTALKKAAKIITPSNYTKNDLIKFFPTTLGKIKVIYEGVEQRFTKRLAKSEKRQGKYKIKKPYILYVGLWREHKNVVGLIKAFEKIKQNYRTIERDKICSKPELKNLQNLKLVIVGKSDPYYPEVPEAVKKSPFKKDIVLSSYLSDEDLLCLYQNAQAFVIPSFYEGFGLPALEAMACQCPVLSSKVASLPEILEDAALYFNPRNIKEMANKIAQVLGDRDLRKSLTEKGLKQVKKYSFKKMAEETLKVYNEAMKGR